MTSLLIGIGAGFVIGNVAFVNNKFPEVRYSARSGVLIGLTLIAVGVTLLVVS